MDENKNTPAPEASAKREKRSYKSFETVFAWLAIVAGYFFWKVIDVGSRPLGALAYIALIYIFAFLMLRANGKKLSKDGAMLGASGLIIGFSVMTASSLLPYLSFLYALAAGVCLVYFSTGNALGSIFDDTVCWDATRAVFTIPFSSFTRLFGGLFSKVGRKKSATALYILLGAAVSALFVWVISSQLSYDAAFKKAMDNIFSFDADALTGFGGDILIGIPVAMYIFGLYISSVDNTCTGRRTKEQYLARAEKRRIAPLATVLAACIPVIAVYCLFFVLQLRKYVSGFSGILPEDTTYAEFAREGFFELCKVSAVNLALIAAINAYARRTESASEKALKILSCVLAVFSLILLSTAAAKMAMYVSMYGLTLRRVLASWFMVVLALIFVLVIIKQFKAGFRLVPIALAVTVGLYACLALSGVESIIADYNVNRYLNGTLYDVDVCELYHLGDAAVPSVLKLCDKLGVEYSSSKWYADCDLYDETLELRAAACLHLLVNDAKEDSGFFSLNIPHAKADAAIKAAGIN